MTIVHKDNFNELKWNSTVNKSAFRLYVRWMKGPYVTVMLLNALFAGIRLLVSIRRPAMLAVIKQTIVPARNARKAT